MYIIENKSYNSKRSIKFQMVQLTRGTLDYENVSTRFLINEKDLRDNCFQRQFFHAYRARASIMRPKIIAAAKEKFGLFLFIYFFF